MDKGKIKIELKVSGPKTILDNFPEEVFNDGRWHQVILTMSPNTIVLNVDERPMRTTRQLSFTTGQHYLIAGGKTGTRGFIGCMRRISIDGNYKPPIDWKENVCEILIKRQQIPHKGLCIGILLQRGGSL